MNYFQTMPRTNFHTESKEYYVEEEMQQKIPHSLYPAVSKRKQSEELGKRMVHI